MLFRDISWFLTLSPLQVTILSLTMVLSLAVTTFIMYVILKVLQREAVFGVPSTGSFGYFRVLDTRIITWALFAFIMMLNVELVQLAWMLIVAILIMLLSYEFLFDLGAVKTPAAVVIDFVLTVLSFAAVVMVYRMLGGTADLSVIGF